MTQIQGSTALDDTSQSDSGYSVIRDDSSIQFAPVKPPEQAKQPEQLKAPEWLEYLGQVLSDFFGPIGAWFSGSWPILKWAILAAAAALLLYLLWNLLKPVLNFRPRNTQEEEDIWVPQESEAIALLSEADRLAAEGQYDAATHLLLRRSVSQIAAARPEWVEPSSTARELAALSALPDTARAAFATIADRVEHSIFALRALKAEDWNAARTAYAEFALQSLRGGTR